MAGSSVRKVVCRAEAVVDEEGQDYGELSQNEGPCGERLCRWLHWQSCALISERDENDEYDYDEIMEQRLWGT